MLQGAARPRKWPPGIVQARVVSVELPAEHLAEAARIYQDAVLPVCKGQQGFRGALLLSDAEGGRAISITLWETEPDMRAGESSDYFQAQSERVQVLVSGVPRREYFRVESVSIPTE